MILKSYAKVNLYLKILNKRPDNYHNLDTIFERISLFDTIVLSGRKDNLIKITCSDKNVPTDNTNFCYKAAKLLQDKFKINSGVNIRIKKRIPVAAGLGGGSSNAATVLLGLNKLWKLGLSTEKLAKLAAKTGSDTAFFVYNTPFAQGRGRGEKITLLPKLKKLKFWHILIVPGIKVSTPHIYREWDKQDKGLTMVSSDVKILRFGQPLFNSLESVTLRLYPQVRQVKYALQGLGLNSVLMSGSGPAVFALVASKKQAVSLSEKLKELTPSSRFFVVKTA